MDPITLGLLISGILLSIFTLVGFIIWWIRFFLRTSDDSSKLKFLPDNSVKELQGSDSQEDIIKYSFLDKKSDSTPKTSIMARILNFSNQNIDTIINQLGEYFKKTFTLNEESASFINSEIGKFMRSSDMRYTSKYSTQSTTINFVFIKNGLSPTNPSRTNFVFEFEFKSDNSDQPTEKHDDKNKPQLPTLGSVHN